MIIRKASGGNVIADEIEHALTPFQKAKGLMGRKDIPEGYGMLFDLGREKKEGFWMLFMKAPIDIVFIRNDKKIADIKHSAKPISLNPSTWKIFYPKSPARWVLELRAQTMKRHKIEIGEKLDF